jgi:hypothetical protein
VFGPFAPKTLAYRNTNRIAVRASPCGIRLELGKPGRALTRDERLAARGRVVKTLRRISGLVPGRRESIHQSFTCGRYQIADSLRKGREKHALKDSADTRIQVKTQLKPSATPFAVVEVTKQIASSKSLQIASFVISLLICIFCSVEGGYQLHLSHDHAALSCIQLEVPMTAGEQIDSQPYQIDPPPCCENAKTMRLRPAI